MWTADFAATHKFSSDPVIVEPDVTEVRFLPGDEFLLMATDGLWDCMKPPEAVAYARKQFKAGGGKLSAWGAVAGCPRGGLLSTVSCSAGRMRCLTRAITLPPPSLSSPHPHTLVTPHPPGKDAQQVADLMTSIAVKRYTADNVAVVVVDLRADKQAGSSSGGSRSKGGGGGGLFGGLFGGR
jgi:serine/threonine protein phosphatase PrpC